MCFANQILGIDHLLQTQSAFQGDSGGALWALYSTGPQYRIVGIVAAVESLNGSNVCTDYLPSVMNGFLPGHDPQALWVAPYAVQGFLEPIVGAGVWCPSA